MSTSQDTLSGLTYPERRLSRISPLFTNPFYSPSLPLLSSPTNDEPSAPSIPRVLSVHLASITPFDPTPFTLGTVHSRRKRGRHIYSASTQACTGHGFFKECSVRLRPHADDNIMRPCLALPPCHFTREHVLTQSTLHASPRQRHFGRRANLNFIYSSSLALRTADTPLANSSMKLKSSSAPFHPDQTLFS